MKFLAITLLAACLIQGNHAQVGGPRDLSAGAQSLLDSVSGLSVEDILNATSRLDASQLLELIQGAQGNVTTEISVVVDRLFMIISNVKESAMEIVEGALEGSGVSLDDVRTILDEAVDAGVISDCAAKTTDELGVSSAFKCVGDLLNTTITLTANISHVSARAFNLSAEYAFNDTTCSAEKNPEEKRTCQFNLIRAVAVRSIMLVKELSRYANQVTILSNTLQSSLGSCVALARALTEPLRNVKAALKIISCLSGKIAN